MKRPVSYKLLPWPIAAMGCMSLFLRFALYTMENQIGLLPARHPLYLASLVLAGAAASILLGFLPRLKGPQGYQENFPFSRPRAQGSFVAGLLMFPIAAGIFSSYTTILQLIWGVLGFAASVCLIASGYFQLKDEKPPFFLYLVICLFFVCHMVCSYQSWSGNPQVEDYIFSLFACIFLSLFAYQKAAFSTEMGSRRILLFSGLMAVFFCSGALHSPDDARFYAAGGLWAISNLCVIDPPKAEEF